VKGCQQKRSGICDRNKGGVFAEDRKGVSVVKRRKRRGV